MKTRVPIVRLDHGQDIDFPTYGTAGAAGLDLRAAVPEGEPRVLQPGERALIPTGFAIAAPEGFEAQIRPRSGLALKHGLTCLNSPGTVDSDYRGEVGVILINQGQEPFTIRRGERIAQLVFARYEKVEWHIVQEMESTERGEGGFGSTGRE